MRFYCISDNVDTQVGLRLVGIEGQVVHKRREFLEWLEEESKIPSENQSGLNVVKQYLNTCLY